jgi:probable F420-dependent oxidoreductase
MRGHRPAGGLWTSDVLGSEGAHVKFAMVVPTGGGISADPDRVIQFARHAESCGFESVIVVEHAVVVRQSQSTYPYARSGVMPLAVDEAIPDPLDLLAYLAASTDRVGLATGVLVLPNHHPVVLAKRMATIDVMSRGRLRVAVGAGWMREEIEACGVDFETRGRRVNESIDVLRALWTDAGPSGASFAGEFFNFDGVHSFPKPAQPDGIPIHVGGHSPAAARRAGRRGDGLQPLGVNRDRLHELVKIMRSEAQQAGRDPDALELSLGGSLARTTEATVAAARDSGADRMVLASSVEDFNAVLDEMSAFAERFALATA